MEETMKDAQVYILKKLNGQGDYDFLPAGMLEEMLDKLMELDAGFMKETGVEEGAAYDDDAALAALHKGMAKCFAEYSMYMMRLTEDYLDYNEEYLDSIGVIDWS